MKKIFFRAGHGGKDPGAVANGLIEKVINLKVVLEAERLIKESYSKYFEIKQARSTDVYLSLSAGCDIANNWGADLFISVHHNAGGGDGCEVYHSINTKTGDEFAKLLADEYIALGQNAHGKAVKTRESIKRPGYDYYTELGSTKMTAVISEFAFLDSKDHEIIDSDEEITKEAEAIVKAICKFYGIPEVKKSTLLSLGSTGEEVEKLQKLINKLFKLNLEIDGDFGVETDKAVRLAQKNLGVTVDGIVGPETLKALAEKEKAIDEFIKGLQIFLNEQCYKGKDNKVLTVDGINGINTTYALNNLINDIEEMIKSYDKVLIMGNIQAAKEQMKKYLITINPNPKINCSVEKLIDYYIEEGEIEGVRGDIAFAQALKETGYFRYGGIVLPSQNNFAGIGALNNNNTGEAAEFPSPRIGVRAQIQHLKGYASTEKPKQDIIDPRYQILVDKGFLGSAPYITDLNGKWAWPGEGYGESILTILTKILAIKVNYEEIIAAQNTEIEKLKSEKLILLNKIKKAKEILS